MLKRAIGSDRLSAIEPVPAGKVYISPVVREAALPGSAQERVRKLKKSFTAQPASGNRQLRAKIL